MKRCVIGFVLWLSFSSAIQANDCSQNWAVIEPFFRPPAEFSKQYGADKSPLFFYDGRPVKSPAEWPKRRKEILDYWMGVMGSWPPLLEKPKLEVLEEKERENFVQKSIRIEIAPGVMQKGYLLFPHGKGPFPAVLVPFYDPESSIGLNPKSELRDFARQLAKRGFVTLAIGTPGGDARKPDLRGAKCQPLSYYAYIAANCHTALANLPEVDAKRIGVVGHSYGGKWAMFASCLYEKFACAVWSDPGIVFDETHPDVNYWEPWYLGFDVEKRRKPGLVTPDNPRTGAYKRIIDAGHDLTELHALMAPRPFLVSGGSVDTGVRWPALNHAIAVNQFLGCTNRVAMTHRPAHSPTPESNAQICAFFEYFLKP